MLKGVSKCLVCTVMLVGACLLSPVADASPTLQNGSKGRDVMLLQEELNSIGYTISSIDGVYGAETEKAVAKFQKDNKLAVTGIVKNSTWRALQDVKNKKALPKSVEKKEKKKTEEARSKKKTDDSKKAAFSLKKPPMLGTPKMTTFFPKSRVNDLIANAKKYIGVPYGFGGATPKAFDCSGYLQYVFGEQGYQIPRTADEQFYQLGAKAKSEKELTSGDLVFFTTYEPGPSHCGIYLGDGKFIHASTSKGVRIDELSNSYWKPRFIGGKRIVK